MKPEEIKVCPLCHEQIPSNILWYDNPYRKLQKVCAFCFIKTNWTESEV